MNHDLLATGKVAKLYLHRNHFGSLLHRKIQEMFFVARCEFLFSCGCFELTVFGPDLKPQQDCFAPVEIICYLDLDEKLHISYDRHLAVEGFQYSFSGRSAR